MRLIAAAALAIAAALAPASALAYPQFQFSTETARCNMCHYSPVGGGLINGWGRDEAGDTISRGGDGSFLHGAWESPRWLSLGGDLRGVIGVKDTGAAEPEMLAFPMQADLYTVAQVSDFVIAITVGARGSARRRDPPPESRFLSREHYVMWRPATSGPYVRAGRFYAPFGLRQPDHTSYTRRDLGYYAFEETYGLGAGWIAGDAWEGHLTGYVRDPITKLGPPGYGVAGMFEKRIRDETGALGGQVKLHVGPESTRAIAGATGKLWLESLDVLLLAEVDGAVETFADAAIDSRGQLIGHLNATYFPTQGVMLGSTLEIFNEDLSLRSAHREAANLIIQYFPRAHWEWMLLGKLERVGGGEVDAYALLMVHYYL